LLLLLLQFAAPVNAADEISQAVTARMVDFTMVEGLY
jgi:hypothetical protein